MPSIPKKKSNTTSVAKKSNLSVAVVPHILVLNNSEHIDTSACGTSHPADLPPVFYLPGGTSPGYIRRLTITNFHSIQYRKPDYYNQKYEFEVPQIKLSGKWLEKAGFPMRGTAEIFVSDGLLVIRPVKE